MLVRQVMLPQQILPVVIAVGSADHAVDVFARGSATSTGSVAQIRRSLVIEFNENDWTVDAVVEDALRV